MLFDLGHCLFMLISLIVMISLMVLFNKFVKLEKYKTLILKVCAVLTLVLHFSIIWVEYFKNGVAQVGSAYLLPVYPCHITMWLLTIVAFAKNKESKLFKAVADATFYLGMIGGSIGVLLNIDYSSNPNLLDWNVLKGLVSHVTMMIGCLYLPVGGFIKIRVSNMFGTTLGSFALVLDGGIVIALHKLANISCPNVMFLLQPPYENLPWINTWTLGFTALLLVFIFTVTYEFFALKKEDRWYTKIKNFVNSKKSVVLENENNILKEEAKENLEDKNNSQNLKEDKNDLHNLKE